MPSPTCPALCPLLAPQAPTLLAGVDEAGRGCLAGPVVAGAVILPAQYTLEGLDDSKALSQRKREELAPRIKACAVAWGVGVIWPWEIDQCNILQATFRAMSRAVCAMHKAQTAGLRLAIDGNKVIPEAVLEPLWKKAQPTLHLPAQECFIKGDARIPCISAASVLAKTFRDALMVSLGKRYPAYDFGGHKGYGTQEHMQAIRQHGACRQHRMTFAGVKPKPQQQGWLL
jgi:ribonuclease HII